MFTGAVNAIRVPKMQSVAHYPGGSLIVVQSAEATPKLYIFDLALGGAPALTGVINTTNIYKQISFVTATGVVLFDDGSSRAAYADLSAGTISLLSGTLANTSSTTKQNVLAGSTTTQKAMSGVGASGKILAIDASALPTLPTQTLLTVATLAGQVVKTCISKPGSSGTLWVIGTDSGNVYEINISGTVSKTIVLPTTPNIGTSPTTKVSNLAMAGDDLYVFVDSGWCFHYKYSTSALLETLLLHEGSSNTSNAGAAVVSEIVNGQFIHTGPNTNNLVTGIIALSVVDQKRTMEVDCFLVETANPPQYAGISLAAGVGWIAAPYQFGSTASYYDVILIFSLTGLVTGTLPDRAQDPAGTDVTARSILMQRFKTGLSRVEQDQTISSGASNLTAGIADIDYWELASVGTVGSTEKFDWRRSHS